jgi:outer membrane lipoprotein carrier protein
VKSSVKSIVVHAALVLMMAAAPLLAADRPGVQQIAEAVDRHYNQMITLQTDFVETYRGMGMSRTEAGTLWLKKPGKMRWEYREPREKLFVSDGKTGWFYVKGDQQVRKAEMKNLDDLRSPLRYLLGRTKLLREFEGLSLAPDVKPGSAANVVLRGVPKGLENRVSEVLLEITPEHMIERIVIQEPDGAITEFRFTNQRENMAVAESRFRFQPPPGVEMVEMRELAQ